MGRQICPSTGKVAFPNRLEAELALADIHRSNSHHRHRKYRDESVRVYCCQYCDSWHMTSTPATENRDSA